MDQKQRPAVSPNSENGRSPGPADPRSAGRAGVLLVGAFILAMASFLASHACGPTFSPGADASDGAVPDRPAAPPVRVVEHQELVSVDESSFTLTWVTDVAAKGAVEHVAGGVSKRFACPEPATRYHQCRVVGLQPGVDYSYSIISGSVPRICPPIGCSSSPTAKTGFRSAAGCSVTLSSITPAKVS